MWLVQAFQNLKVKKIFVLSALLTMILIALYMVPEGEIYP